MAVVFAVLLLVGLHMPLPLPAAADQPLAQFCGDAGSYTANGTYQSNLALVAATLPSNTSSIPELFAAATAGVAPDAVFALALCRGDLLGNATACNDCVAAAFQRAQQRCPFDRGATVYNDDCLLRFSNATVLISDDLADNTTLFEAWSPRSIGGGDARAFAADVNELLAQTTWLAGTTGRRFTTGVMDGGGGAAATPTLYSLAQCTPELTAGDCLACLQRLVGMVNSTTGARMGGRILTVRCNFRFETFKFYNGAPLQRILPPGSAPPPAPAPAKRDGSRSKAWVIAAVVAPLAAVALCVTFYCRFWRTRKKDNKGQLIQHESLRGRDEQVWVMEPELSKFSVFDLREVLEATNNFSEENKLGEGGFGPVYKGQFSDGLEIAVKRLSSHSGQGFVEFKNEVQLIAKLQHTNLVRLLGCCFQGVENILVYEYLSNKSLDFFIFDENRKALLDWNKRLAIIEGIAQGLLYLHKHSRLRVIHRDLKPSNILLDNEMNPKISDFGLAKIFSSNSNGETTRRVVGTYGYMAPEYASEGHFSMKSDVFSFGVLTLEILSGKRNSDFNQCGDFINHIGYAWKLWEEERWTELIDDSLELESESLSMMRCINIALLCVQENAVDRPTMSDVVAMLSSESIVLVGPKHPAYFHVRVTNMDASVVTETYSDLTMYEKPKY